MTGHDTAPANKASPDATTLTTVTIAENPAINCGINPINMSIGPATNANAAANPATIAIVDFVLSDNPLNQSANCCNHPTTFLIAGNNASPSDIIISSNADFNSVNAPPRLSCIISAISPAAPSELRNCSSKSPITPTPSLAYTLNPFSACSPMIDDKAWSRWLSDMPSVALIKSSITSVMSRISPLESYRATV